MEGVVPLYSIFNTGLSISFKSKTISNETTTLIRIDPGNANVPRGHIGVKMKAMEALIGIEKRMSEM